MKKGLQSQLRYQQMPPVDDSYEEFPYNSPQPMKNQSEFLHNINNSIVRKPLQTIEGDSSTERRTDDKTMVRDVSMQLSQGSALESVTTEMQSINFKMTQGTTKEYRQYLKRYRGTAEHSNVSHVNSGLKKNKMRISEDHKVYEREGDFDVLKHAGVPAYFKDQCNQEFQLAKDRARSLVARQKQRYHHNLSALTQSQQVQQGTSMATLDLVEARSKNRKEANILGHKLGMRVDLSMQQNSLTGSKINLKKIAQVNAVNRNASLPIISHHDMRSLNNTEIKKSSINIKGLLTPSKQLPLIADQYAEIGGSSITSIRRSDYDEVPDSVRTLPDPVVQFETVRQSNEKLKIPSQAPQSLKPKKTITVKPKLNLFQKHQISESDENKCYGGIDIEELYAKYMKIGAEAFEDPELVRRLRKNPKLEEARKQYTELYGELPPAERPKSRAFDQSKVEQAISNMDCTQIKPCSFPIDRYNKAVNPLVPGKMGMTQVNAVMREHIEARLQKERIAQLIYENKYYQFYPKIKGRPQKFKPEQKNEIFNDNRERGDLTGLNNYQNFVRKFKRIPEFRTWKSVQGTEVVEYHDCKTSDDVLQLFLDELNNRRETINDQAKMVEPTTPKREVIDDIATQLQRGIDARVEATQLYRKTDFLKSKIEMGTLKTTPLVEYFNDIQKQQVPPRIRGLVHSFDRESNFELNMAKQFLSEAQTEAMTRALNKSRFIKYMDLSDCGLDDGKLEKILNAVDPFMLTNINLSNNPKLTRKSYERIMELANDTRSNLSVLKLEGNKMGDATFKYLSESLKTYKKLEQLNISNNDLTDKSADLISQIITSNEHLRVFFCHYNRLLGKGSSKIAEAIGQHKNLQILDMSHNAITSLGHKYIDPVTSNPKAAKARGAELAAEREAAALNKKVKAPAKSTGEFVKGFAEKWSDCFKNSQSLIHIDLSKNNIESSDVEIMAQGLKENQTILGIHFAGNQGYIDNQGYLKPSKFGDNSMADRVMMMRIPDHLETGTIRNKQVTQLQFCSNCWLCEGWSPHEFKFEPGVSCEQPEIDEFHAVKLHLQVDEYQGELILPGSGGVYTTTRMLPPGNHKYFFSVQNQVHVALDQPQYDEDKEEGKVFVSAKQPKELLKIDLPRASQDTGHKTMKSGIDLAFDGKLNKPFHSVRGSTISQGSLSQRSKKTRGSIAQEAEENPWLNLELPVTNVLENIIQTTKPFDEIDLENDWTIPRPGDKALGNRTKMRTPWKYNLSVFREYKLDNAKQLAQCFELDWNNTKIPKFLKAEDEIANMKALLSENYAYFRHSYKFLSGVDPQKDLSCIGMNTLSDVVQNGMVGFVDNKSTKLADIDFEFIATNAGGKANKRNPERMLVRHNWIEIFVRLATNRYLKVLKTASTPTEAMKQMLDEFLIPYCSKFTQDNWRKQKFYNEEVDYALKQGLDTMKKAYKQFSGKYAKPSEPHTMSLDEFTTLIDNLGIYNESFGAKQVACQFSMSMMTQVDELESDRHMCMSFTEFIEAMGRVADKLDIPNLETDSQYTYQDIAEGNVTDEDKKSFASRPLDQKVQALLQVLALVLGKQKLYKQHMDKIQKYRDDGLWANDIPTGSLKLQ